MDDKDRIPLDFGGYYLAKSGKPNHNGNLHYKICRPRLSGSEEITREEHVQAHDELWIAEFKFPVKVDKRVLKEPDDLAMLFVADIKEALAHTEERCDISHDLAYRKGFKAGWNAAQDGSRGEAKLRMVNNRGNDALARSIAMKQALQETENEEAKGDE